MRPDDAGDEVAEELPILDLDAEDLADERRAVLITGACGTIGRKLRAAWAVLYEMVLIDVAAGPDDPAVIAADLAELDDRWITHFHGVDTVVHLAANPDPRASWEELERPNLDALSNVLMASVLAGVDRVVFASSNHAMGGYRDRDDGPITVDLPPRPDGPYGASKLMGERLGKSCALAFDLSFVALRLGLVQPGANRPDTIRDDWDRALWLSDADLVRLFGRAVEAELDDRAFVVVNGLSKNRGTRWDLAHAAAVLRYDPEDDVFNA